MVPYYSFPLLNGMWKIIKKSLDYLIVEKHKSFLWMKWQFMVQFHNDRFWPYDYKFEREDCYFNETLQDRGSQQFPYKNQEFQNTEIFLENTSLLVCTGERNGLLIQNQAFIDIINLETEKKCRVNTSEVNLIYNESEKVIINAKISGVWKTLVLDLYSLDIIEERQETLLAFFKCIYQSETWKWYVLNYIKWENNKNTWYFLPQILYNVTIIPKQFNRKEFLIDESLNVWFTSSNILNYTQKANSSSFYPEYWKQKSANFPQNQKYILGKNERKKVITNFLFQILHQRMELYLIRIHGIVCIFLWLALWISCMYLYLKVNFDLFLWSLACIVPLVGLFFTIGYQSLFHWEVHNLKDYFLTRNQLNFLFVTVLVIMSIFEILLFFGKIFFLRIWVLLWYIYIEKMRLKNKEKPYIAQFIEYLSRFNVINIILFPLVFCLFFPIILTIFLKGILSKYEIHKLIPNGSLTGSFQQLDQTRFSNLTYELVQK